MSNPSIFDANIKGDVYIFDVEEMIETLENPPDNVDLTRTPLDDINPNISVAASNGERSPVFLGFLPYGMAASPGSSDWLNLTGPTSTTEDLLPEFKWEFEPSDEIEELSLFVSVFEKNEGLLPWDNFVDFSGPNGNPFLADQGLNKGEQIDLLSQPWEVSQYRQEDDFNPNRILTVTWKKDEAGTGGTWYLGDGTEIYDTDATPISFKLEEDRTLTVGQTYHWGVEAYRQDGNDRTFKSASFELEPELPDDDSNTFSSASIITHGFKPPLFDQPGVPEAFYQLGGDILDSQNRLDSPNGGLMMRYDRPTGYWVPVDEQGQIPGDFPAGLNPNAPGYKDALLEYLLEGDDELKDEYRQKPLVLLSDWSGDNESGIPDSGFSEAAADSIFSSLVQLDQWLGGSVGSPDPNVGLYDANGDLIRNQGALFNSPLHFIGFSRGTVVNSEMIQRLGTFFPNAGGTDDSNRDLQMTTLDPHDFNQPSLDVVEVKLPLVPPIELDYSDFFEPKVQVWDKVTFADNYYQTIPDLEGRTLTPAGRDIPRLPETDEYGVPWPREGWRNGNQNPDAPLLGEADVSVRLGANSDDNENYLSSRAGFTKETDPIKFGDIEVFKGLGGVHGRVVSWYAGTSNLEWEGSEWDGSQKNVVFRRQGEPTSQELFDKEFYDEELTPRFNPWYVPNHEGVLAEDELESLPWEGIGTGWFYSVLGGGKKLRPKTGVNKVPVDFDNTDSERMRGDFAVPTLFNGNFDAVTKPHDLVRNSVSDAVPGWSFHFFKDKKNEGSEEIHDDLSTSMLVDLKKVDSLKEHLKKVGNDPDSDDYQTNYAVKLKNDESVTHNRFVVPDWGTLRFDLHVPNPKGGKVKVSIKGTEPGQMWQELSAIESQFTDGTSNIINQLKGVELVAGDNPKESSFHFNQISYGKTGFETFHLDVPEELRGKQAKLRFEIEGETTEVYLDNVFFKSKHLMLGNPGEARFTRGSNPNTQQFLIERPQYSLSYSDGNKTPNWASWQLDKTWIAKDRVDSFHQDDTLPAQWNRVPSGVFPNPWARGHLAPNADRNRNLKDMDATFAMTNMIPQHGSNNSGVWSRVEKFARQVVTDKNKEVYIIAGGYGDQGKFNTTNDGKTFQVTIPERVWKVMVVLEPGQGLADIDQNTQIVAVDFPNSKVDGGTRSPKWANNLVTVRTIEDSLKAAGMDYDLLSHVPRKIQDIIEKEVFTYPGKKPLDGIRD